MGKKQKKEQKARKMLLMGLDNAGKTSLYLILSKNANLLSYYSVKPTKGLSIQTLNEGTDQYSIWDFGGQMQFRKDYLDNIDEYLKEADKIIYVIDIQDRTRYEESLEYLNQIVDAIKKKNVLIPFSIFLHKFDKGLEDDDNFKPERLNANLINKISNIMASFYFEVFKTTILTLFQKTKWI